MEQNGQPVPADVQNSHGRNREKRRFAREARIFGASVIVHVSPAAVFELENGLADMSGAASRA
jgi:hypothetical protein